MQFTMAVAHAVWTTKRLLESMEMFPDLPPNPTYLWDLDNARADVMNYSMKLTMPEADLILTLSQFRDAYRELYTPEKARRYVLLSYNDLLVSIAISAYWHV